MVINQQIPDIREGYSPHARKLSLAGGQARQNALRQAQGNGERSRTMRSPTKHHIYYELIAK